LAEELTELKRIIATTTDNIEEGAAQAQAILARQQNEVHETNQNYATLSLLLFKEKEDLEKKQKELTEVQGQLTQAQTDLREEQAKTADLQSLLDPSRHPLTGLADRLDRRQAEQRLLKAQIELRKEQEKTAGLQRELERMKKTLAEKEPEGEAVPPAEAEIVVTNPAAEAEAADRKEGPATGVPEGKI